jgi:hypothetical protein
VAAKEAEKESGNKVGDVAHRVEAGANASWRCRVKYFRNIFVKQARNKVEVRQRAISARSSLTFV